MILRAKGEFPLSARQIQTANPALYLNCDTSAPVNIYLPKVPGDETFWGTRIFVLDGNPLKAGTNPITIYAATPSLINGQSFVTINLNNGVGCITVAGPNNYLFTSSAGSGGNTASIITEGDGATYALPLLITVNKDQVYNISTQLKAVADSGEIYSVTLVRTIIGVGRYPPPGAIEGVDAAKEVSKQTRGIFTFGIDYTTTDTTGYIQFVGQTGKIITITIKESYD